MDSRGLNCSEGNMTNTQRRGLDLDLDLNYPHPSQMTPPDLSLGLTYTNSQEVNVQAQVHRWSHHQTRNVIEILDDEVAIIFPREYAEARENSKRNNSRGILSEARGILSGHTGVTTLCNNCNRRILDDCQPCLKPGTSNKKKAKNVSLVQELPQPIPVPEESIFSCPICMGPLIEPTSTKCGHIFCKECLLRSIKSLRSKCPTCRQKVGKRGIFRVYLPTTN